MDSSSEDELICQQPTMSYSSAVKIPTRPAGSWNLSGYNRELLDRILDNIAESPGQTAELSKKALKAFQWRIEDGNYIVALPVNLSEFQLNPVVQAAVASIYLLKAKIVESCPSRIDSVEYLEPMGEYIRGLAAALKLGGAGKALVADPFSGLFHQGYRWAASEGMYARKFSRRVFRLDYRPPKDCFPDKLFKQDHVNTAMYQAWCTLVKEAAKRLDVSEPHKWAKSYQEIYDRHIKKTWQYESRAVFSADEVKAMTIYASIERSRYNEFLKQLKDPEDKFLLSYDTTYSEVTTSLHKYDITLARIASLRASVIFKETNSSSKAKRVPLTREDRVQQLDLYHWIVATNPTGLFGDERSEFQVKVRRGTPDEMETWGQFCDWVMRLPRSTYMANPLIYQWAAEVATRATVLLEPEVAYVNPIEVGTAKGVLDECLVQNGLSSLERIRLGGAIGSPSTL
jgi:hypothetical protein